MPNHPHLCIRTDGAPLSVVMHRINTLHAKHFNRKYSLTGHLHEGRYRALLIHEPTYLVRLVRYIHRNPVRAGLASTVSEWPYSSHHEYVAPETWLDRAPALRVFGNRAAYEAFMAEETSQEDHEVFSRAGKGFGFAGNEASVEGVVQTILAENRRPSSAWLPLGRADLLCKDDIERDARDWLHQQARPPALEAIQGPARHEPLRSARRQLASFLRSKRYPLRSIAALLRRDAPAVSRLIGRARAARCR
jgi:hypothetical protein